MEKKLENDMETWIRSELILYATMLLGLIGSSFMVPSSYLLIYCRNACRLGSYHLPRRQRFRALGF